MRCFSRSFRYAWLALPLALLLALSACSSTGGTDSSSTTGTDGSTSTIGSGGTPTSTPASFSITGATVTVSPSNYQGSCNATMLFTFTATFAAPTGNPGGTASYIWTRSDGAQSGTAQTITFAPSQTVATATTTWQLGSTYGNGQQFWEAVQVQSPNTLTSNQGAFSFHCTSGGTFQVTSVSAAVDAGSYTCANGGQTFTFTATINVAPNTGGTVTYDWLRSDGATHAPYTVSVPSGSSSVTVSTTWTVGYGIPNGTYWEQVQTTAPNSITSNQATFMMRCHLQVIAASASASPTSYDCANASQFISFNGTITFAPGNNGGTLSYTWGRSDGAVQTTPYTASIPPGTTTYTLPVYPATNGEYWDIGKAAGNGTYWEKIQIAAPNSFTSNQASFTINC